MIFFYLGLLFFPPAWSLHPGYLMLWFSMTTLWWAIVTGLLACWGALAIWRRLSPAGRRIAEATMAAAAGAAWIAVVTEPIIDCDYLWWVVECWFRP